MAINNELLGLGIVVAIGAYALSRLSRGTDSNGYGSGPGVDLDELDDSTPDTYGSGDPFSDATDTGTTPVGTTATEEEFKERVRDVTREPIRSVKELGSRRSGGGIV